MVPVEDLFDAHRGSQIIDLCVAIRMAAGRLMAHQNVSLLHAQAEIIVRVDVRQGMLFLRGHHISWLMPQVQAIEELLVVLDSRVRLSRKPHRSLECSTKASDTMTGNGGYTAM